MLGAPLSKEAEGLRSPSGPGGLPPTCYAPKTQIQEQKPVMFFFSLVLPCYMPVSFCHTYNTHTHTHSGHNTDTQGCGSRTPEGGYGLSLAFRAQPAPETALGWASPGQAGAKRLGLPSPGSGSGIGEGAASLHSRHCLKENGGPCPPGGRLEGSAWPPVWLSRSPPLL